MGEIVAITGLATLVKTALEAVSAARKATTDPEALKDLTKAKDSIADLQTRLFTFQEVAFKLQEENRDLREEIRGHKERLAERESYERKKVGQSFVYLPKGETEPMLCPNCFDAGKHGYLDMDRNGARCPLCDTYITFKPSSDSPLQVF